MPNAEIIELLNFQQCADLYGNSQRVCSGRRNGQPFLFLSSSFDTPAAKVECPAPELGSQSRLFVNLNPIERETWRKILNAESIASIADEEGVSRAAVYNRILGSSRGRGGMIRKNFWVLLWWEMRQRIMAGVR
jgi:hypothetical protein